MDYAIFMLLFSNSTLKFTAGEAPSESTGKDRKKGITNKMQLLQGGYFAYGIGF
jgi:hypothetical protein